MTDRNSINNISVTPPSKEIIFVKGKLEEIVMPKNESNEVQIGKLKDKFFSHLSTMWNCRTSK
jgi:uridine kinase